MTPPPEDDPPPPKKRRRPPPKGLEGFDTGYPEETDAPESGPASASGAVRKPIWSDSGPVPSALAPSSPSAPVPTSAPIPTASGSTAPIASVPGAPVPSETPAEPAAEASVVLDPSVSAIPADAAAGGSYGGSYGGNYGGSATGGYGSSYGGNYGATDPAAFPTYVPPASSSANLDRDEPLSAAASDPDLREAVGAKSKKKKPKRARTPPPDITPSDFDDDDDLGDGPRRSRKMIAVSVISLVVGLGVAALVFLGRANSAWFYLSCEADKIVAQQGRSFPPWGESTLTGKQWVAIKIPPEAECIPLETESEDELGDHFRAMLVKRASVLLTAKEVTKTDEANALLEQALLHARSNTDNARNARTEIQRLLGDVVYWRASLKMRDASKALLEAAKQFDAAAQQRPRHVTDASAWAEYVRKVVGELESGPAGSAQTVFPPTPPPSEPRTQAPPGVALPVEPGKGSAIEVPPSTPPDAGLPTGGVLL